MQRKIITSSQNIQSLGICKRQKKKVILYLIDIQTQQPEFTESTIKLHPIKEPSLWNKIQISQSYKVGIL